MRSFGLAARNTLKVRAELISLSGSVVHQRMNILQEMWRLPCALQVI